MPIRSNSLAQHYPTSHIMWLLIDNKPQDMNNIHPITLSNHELPHTSKYQYLGYIIHNNLTDDYIARLKISTFAQATILARQLHLCNPTIKHPQSIRYCATGFWCKLKKQSLNGITSHTARWKCHYTGIPRNYLSFFKLGSAFMLFSRLGQ